MSSTVLDKQLMEQKDSMGEQENHSYYFAGYIQRAFSCIALGVEHYVDGPSHEPYYCKSYR